jgi:hypothetical protein
VAPRGIKEGDVIWKVDWTNTIAVLRPQTGRFTVVGKAVIADGVLKKQVVSETTRGFYNSVKGTYRYITNYFTPQDLKDPNVSHQAGRLIWSQAKFGASKYETPPEEELSIKISTPVLQALTSPLRWQKKGLKGKA